MNVGIGKHQILGKIATGRLPCPLPDISEHRSDQTWDVGLLSGYRQFVSHAVGQPAFRVRHKGARIGQPGPKRTVAHQQLLFWAEHSRGHQHPGARQPQFAHPTRRITKRSSGVYHAEVDA